MTQSKSEPQTEPQVCPEVCPEVPTAAGDDFDCPAGPEVDAGPLPSAVLRPESAAGPAAGPGAQDAVWARSEPDWLDEREQRAWRGYIALEREVRGRLARQLLRETGLTSAEYAVLVSLSEAPGGRLRVFQLRHAAEWEKTRLTHQITRMVQRGLVARQPCEDDPRGAFVVLTEAGWEAISEAAPRHVAHVRHWFFDALTAEQVDALIDLSRAVLSRLPEADRTMGEPCSSEPACGGHDEALP